jgi:hypothetical protein
LTSHTLPTTHNSIVQLTECTAGQTRTQIQASAKESFSANQFIIIISQ